MVKVIFENIDSSYYDNKAKKLHLRENLIGNKEGLSKVLEHETEHIRLDDKLLSWTDNKIIIWMYRWLIHEKFLLWLILIPASIYLQYYTNNWMLQQSLNQCTKELAIKSIPPIIKNLTFNIT